MSSSPKHSQPSLIEFKGTYIGAYGESHDGSHWLQKQPVPDIIRVRNTSERSSDPGRGVQRSGQDAAAGELVELPYRR